MEFDGQVLRTAIIEAVSAAVALGLAANRTRNPPLPPARWPAGRPAPYVEIIVPARNEERNIAYVLQSLLRQSYPAGRWGISVVDDHSSDHTTRVVLRFIGAGRNLRLIRARELLPGWTGKNNAMYSGFLAAPHQAEYLLFVDADTEFHPDMLAAVVLAAQTRNAVLLSLVLDIDLATFWQCLLVPQAGELYTMLAGSMDAVNRPDGPAAANGQCMLLAKSAYGRFGALPEVIADVAEDRALAAAMKQRGAVIRLEHGERLGRVKPYASLREAWFGYTKTLYWAAGRNPLRTLAVLLALEVYAHLPLVDLAVGLARPHHAKRTRTIAHTALRLLPMLALRLYVCRTMRVPARYALLYPLAVAMGNAMLLTSWVITGSRRGVSWKGRIYSDSVRVHRECVRDTREN